jgi:hypothetical protein
MKMEDGIRTSGEKRNLWMVVFWRAFRWWKHDSIFFTKFMTNINKSLTPLVTLNIDKADGTKIEKSFSVIQTIFLLQKIRVTLKLEKIISWEI